MKMKRLLLIALILGPWTLRAQGQPQLQSLTLDQVIARALARNQSLRLDRLQARSAVSQAKATQAIILPQVDFSFSGNYAGAFPAETTVGIDSLSTSFGTVYYPVQQLTGNYGDLTWADRYSLNLSLSQNLYDGGRWWNTLKAAEVSTDLAGITLDQSRINTVYLAKQAFYAYLNTKNLLDVYQENLKSAKKQHELALERFRVGAASLNDTLRTRVGVARARLQIINGEKALAQQSKNLNLILVRPWDTPVALIEATWQAVKVPSLEEAWTFAQKNNPGLLKLERNETLSKYNVKIAKSGYIPSVGLSVDYSNTAKNPGDVMAKDNTNLTAGLRLNWNLFNGWHTKRTVEQKYIAAKSATENLIYVRDQLKKDIAQTILEMQDLEESLQISRIIRDASKQDYDLILEQYQVGSASILDVIRIEADYENARVGVIQSRYSLKLAEAKLYQLMGKSV